jgi:hypothetical protein
MTGVVVYRVLQMSGLVMGQGVNRVIRHSDVAGSKLHRMAGPYMAACSVTHCRTRVDTLQGDAMGIGGIVANHRDLVVAMLVWSTDNNSGVRFAGAMRSRILRVAGAHGYVGTMGVIRARKRGGIKHREQREEGENNELTDHLETMFEREYQTS